MVVNKVDVMAAASNYGVSDTVEALTVGNTILVFDTLAIANNGRVTILNQYLEWFR